MLYKLPLASSLPMMLFQLESPQDLPDPSEMVEAAKDDPVLAGVLLVIGIVSLVALFWGIAKSVIKVALFAGLTGAAAWYWYFNL